MLTAFAVSRTAGSDMALVVILFRDGTDRSPDATCFVVLAHTVVIDVQVVRVVRVDPIEGRRPVVAARTHIVQIGVFTAACGRKEDGIIVYKICPPWK